MIQIKKTTNLEICVGENVGSGVKVFEFLEGRHDLRSHDATFLVDKLDGSLAAVVGNAVSDLKLQPF
jgi:hypothetical protein